MKSTSKKIKKGVWDLRFGILLGVGLIFNPYFADAGVYSRAERLEDIGHYLGQLLIQGQKEQALQPEQVLVIFDVHGTLTNRSQPLTDGSAEKPRGAAIQLVKALKRSGVHIVAASAWNDFELVLQALKDVGLDEAFEVSSKTIPWKDLEFQEPNNPGGNRTLLNVFQNGRVVSVKDSLILKEKYYRQKALAPYFTLGEDLSSIRKVVFIDDSKANHEWLQYDLDRFGLFPQIDVDRFILGDPSQDPAVETSVESTFPELAPSPLSRH